MPTMPLPQGGLAFGQTFATTTYGTTLTGSISANTQGTPQELIAATAQDAHWIEVMVGNPSAAASFAVDILIGAATAAPLIPKLTFRGRTANEGGGRWLFPVFVPKGSRIAASVQSSGGNTTCIVGVVLFNSGITSHGMPMDVVQYGTLTTSLGVNVECTVINTKTTTPVEITAATTRDHHWLVLTIANIDVAWAASCKKLIDVLIGASTEAVLVGNLATGGAGTADQQMPEQQFHLPVYVPKGSRLAVQMQASAVTDGDRDIYVTIHGA